MSINPDKRKCSAVRSDGQPCQAWAVIESDPALCPAHAGVQSGAGAPKGNKNAMKHGLYMSILEADELENLEMFESRTLIHELVLMRVMLRRLTLYLNNDDLPLADMLAIMPLVSTMVRTVVRLLNNMEEKGFDWDEVLDELGKDLGIDI